MELETIGSWEENPDTEIFYDAVQACFLFKNQQIIIPKPIYDPNYDPELAIDPLKYYLISNTKLLALNISADNQYLAYQCLPNKLVISI